MLAGKSAADKLKLDENFKKSNHGYNFSNVEYLKQNTNQRQTTHVNQSDYVPKRR